MGQRFGLSTELRLGYRLRRGLLGDVQHLAAPHTERQMRQHAFALVRQQRTLGKGREYVRVWVSPGLLTPRQLFS